MKYRFLVVVLTVLLTSTLSYGQSKTYNSIRQVDFLNFTFPLSWCAKEFKKLPTRVTVKNGRFEIDDYMHVDVEKKAILYTDFTGDNIEKAVVPVMCGPLHANYSGSDEILVFTLRNGKPELLTSLNEDIFERDYRRYYPSKGTSLYLSPESGIKVDHNKLIIYKSSGSCHACEQDDVSIEYLWNGHGFVLAGKPVKKPHLK